ncbi:glycosyltransferase family 1 protein [Stagnimonas aquatica]|uniref:Glycosyltransferase family 1 protein n=1 Tax=Stagnimonas aquatica TaxID=2689987 RepID=A0A3N0VKV3_9GAMM|nr:glycosyltransferase family 4 protein [Stagnimonas aquatica]ROH93396.1 glycosyltransferase family 1 protein [Stagnimonas aquatica]
MSGALRILVVANLPPWVLGGAENQVARLVEAWAGFGHQVEVAGHRIPDGEARLGVAAVRTHRIAVIDRLGRAGRAASYFVSLARLLARIGTRFDVVYARGLGDAAISICLLKAAGFTRLPLVACPINARGAGDAAFIRSVPGWRRIAAVIDRHCDAINLIAPAIADDLAEIGVVTPSLSRIPNGIALAPPLERTVVGPVRRLVWTGRLCAQKGLDLLLVALARVVASGRDFRVELVGDGPDAAMLVGRCRELGLAGHVVFTGPLHRDEIRGRLESADAFVLPSRYEGMSNAALEAMEAGLPLLLTRCGGIDAWVDDTVGWICPPEDVESLFDSLCRLLDVPDADLLARGRRARVLAEHEFGIDAVARRNIELLAAVATAASVATCHEEA